MNYFWILSKIGIIYFVLILLLRILGKREVGQLSIFDLVILLIIADIASLGIDNDGFFLASVLCLILLAVLQKTLSFVLLKIAKLRNICDGSPTIIIYNGILKIKNMRKELYTMDDLVGQMRQADIMDINEIKFAVLETNGSLSIMKKNENKNFIMPIILSGEYVLDNMECIGVLKEDIEYILMKNSLLLKKIMYASVEKDWFLYYYKESKKSKDISQCKIPLRLDKKKDVC